MGQSSSHVDEVAAALEAAAGLNTPPGNGGEAVAGTSDFDKLVRGFEQNREGDLYPEPVVLPAEPTAGGLDDDSRVLTGKLEGTSVHAPAMADAIDAALDKSADAIVAVAQAGGRGKVETEVFREVFRSFVENAPVGMFRLSPLGHLTQVNATLAGMLGAKAPQDLIGVDAAAAVFTDTTEFTRLASQLERKESVRDHQTMWRRPDGGSIIVKIHLRRVTDDKDVTKAYEGSAQDVTDQQKRENRLLAEISEVRRMAEQLASAPRPAVAPGPRELSSLTARLTDKLMSLAEMLDTARQMVGDLLITLQSSDEITLPAMLPAAPTKTAPPVRPPAAARPPAPAAAVQGPPARSWNATTSGPAAPAPGAPRPMLLPTATVSPSPPAAPARTPAGTPRPAAPPKVLTLTAPDGSSADLPVLDGEPIESSSEDIALLPGARAARAARESASGPTMPTQNSHHPGWYNVNDIIRDAAPEFQRRAKLALSGRNFQVKLRTRLRASTPIRTNPDELSDILNQLVGSSVRAMTGPGVVTINTATVAKGTLIAVTDDSTVLPETDKEKIFDPRIPPLNDRIKVLRACRLAMSRHGGKVGVLSEANIGTTVTMRFPRPKAIE